MGVAFQAGSDGAKIGNCPFSQRLFMVLWLKGVTFNVTTVDTKRWAHFCSSKYPLCSHVHMHTLSHPTPSILNLFPSHPEPLSLPTSLHLPFLVLPDPLPVLMPGLSSRRTETVQKLCPGGQLPFLLYGTEVHTDTNKIEEFLEAVLSPPRYWGTQKGVLRELGGSEKERSWKNEK